jgi:mannose-6-phosphate isomerase-like protein (cupin superfamily)
MQRHEHRSETWNIVSGKASVIMNHRRYEYEDENPFDNISVWNLYKENPFNIPKMTWHQGRNDTEEPAHIIEIWKGDRLTEEDIERYDHE